MRHIAHAQAGGMHAQPGCQPEASRCSPAGNAVGVQHGALGRPGRSPCCAEPLCCRVLLLSMRCGMCCAAAVPGEAAAERSHAQAQQQLQRQPVSQLSVTGVSLAVMSRRHGRAAAAAAGPAPAAAQTQPAAPGVTSSSGSSRQDTAQASPSKAAATDLAAVLAAEGWRECHVVLRQWQCNIALCAAARAGKSSGAAGKAAQQPHAGRDQTPPAIVLHYQTAGVNEVGGRNKRGGSPKAAMLCWDGGGSQDAWLAQATSPAWHPTTRS